MLFRNIILCLEFSYVRVFEMCLKCLIEKDEYFKLEKGFFIFYCDGDVNEVRKKL